MWRLVLPLLLFSSACDCSDVIASDQFEFHMSVSHMRAGATHGTEVSYSDDDAFQYLHRWDNDRFEVQWGWPHASSVVFGATPAELELRLSMMVPETRGMFELRALGATICECRTNFIGDTDACRSTNPSDRPTPFCTPLEGTVLINELSLDGCTHGQCAQDMDLAFDLIDSGLDGSLLGTISIVQDQSIECQADSLVPD